MTAPLITVLMSCYNGSRWLTEAIDSILGQTFRNFEFIIIDDGSTDDSRSIIEEHGKKDLRIVPLFKENTGLADSLNKGIEISRGTWIARIDADDISEPDRLEKQLSATEGEAGVVFVGSGLTLIDERGTSLAIHEYPTRHETLLRNLCTGRRFPPHSSAFYRRDIVESIGAYRPRIKRSQDWDLWLRLSEVGRLLAINEPLVRVRCHSAQISHDKSGRRQRLYNKIAVTSYWLRYYGVRDPVSGSEAEFKAFRNFVRFELDKTELHEYMDYIGEIKARLAMGQASSFDNFSLLKYVALRPKYIYRYISAFLIGDRMAHRLARSWQSCSW